QQQQQQDIREFTFQFRVCIMMFAAFIVFSILCLQLWNIQVLNWQDYEDRATRQSVRKIRIPPVRGEIFSSDGKVLAANRASWDVHFHLSEMRQKNRSTTIRHILTESGRVAACIGRENTLTEQQIARHLNYYPAISMPLFRDLTPEELLRLWELTPHIDGMEIVQTPIRIYPYDSLAVHLLGHTRRKDPASAVDRMDFNYYLPDTVGVSGLERYCDDALRGRAGSELVMVNSMGFVSEVLDRPASAFAGKDVYLTLDLKAQQIAEHLLRNQTGSIVVIDTSNGAVVAMASSPTYSVSDYSSKDRYREHLENKDIPFLNRSTMGAYMPGSVIKPLCGLATLYNGGTPEDVVFCSGRSSHGYSRKIACNKRSGHGDMDLANALKHSCNVYFIERGVQAGIDILSYIYASAGIGRKTGIEIPESAGHLPVNGTGWNSNETAFVAFGQGQVTVTPLQVALYFGALANGGILWRPYLVERTVSPGGISENVTQPKKNGTLAATREGLETIRQGLYKVVNEEGGSGVRGKTEKTVLYGKTGTADVEQVQQNTKHVWFAGFAENPVTKKTYSIAVLIERGASGG
ncbi:MAG: hypothetical protein J6Q65_05030, partial [Lentisphaeria bacterium]|nr:hypothetical protein [Lentisphaeria bacterium]